MDESARYMKREKSKQPKNDQNYGDYPKHGFISLQWSASTLLVPFCRTVRMPLPAWDYSA